MFSPTRSATIRSSSGMSGNPSAGKGCVVVAGGAAAAGGGGGDSPGGYLRCHNGGGGGSNGLVLGNGASGSSYNGNGNGGGSSNRTLDNQLRTRRKVAKMLIAVVIMFSINFFPVHLLPIITVRGGNWLAFNIYSVKSESFCKSFCQIILKNTVTL